MITPDSLAVTCLSVKGLQDLPQEMGSRAGLPFPTEVARHTDARWLLTFGDGGATLRRVSGKANIMPSSRPPPPAV